MKRQRANGSQFTVYCLLCTVFLVILFGCASSREIRDCNQHLRQLENEQARFNEEIKEIKTTLEQLTQSVDNLKFNIDVIRKEVLALSNHIGVEPPVIDSQTDVGKLIGQLRSAQYDIDQIITRVVELGKPAFRALISLLKNPDFKLRARTETVLNRLPSKEITPLLFTALKNPEIRVSVVRILGNLKEPAALAVLAEYLDEKASPQLDFVLGEALVKLKDKRGIPRLIEYLKSEDAVQRTIAFDSLAEATGLAFDYKPYASEPERKKATELWEAWWFKSGVIFQFKKE